MESLRRLPPGAGDLLMELIRAGAMIRVLVEQELAIHALRPAELTLLQVLAREPGLSEAAVADRLYIERQGVHRLVRKLHAEGCLERVDADDRASRWQLTLAGTTHLAEAEATLGQLEAPMLDDLPLETRERFRADLRAITEAVRFEERRRLWQLIRSRYW